jgi:hypothetical protein
MTYTVAKDTCEFCEGKDLATAHKLWEQRKQAAANRCTNVGVPDHQVQDLRTGIYAWWDKYFSH